MLAALVYGIWFFLAVEGVPLAAEEAQNPQRDMPRGIIAAMAVLLVTAALILLTPHRAGPARRRSWQSRTTRCRSRCAQRRRRRHCVADFVNYVGLAGLVASFFSIVFAYSRQLFALSRAGYLPRCALGDQHAARPRTWRWSSPAPSGSCWRRSPRTARC